MEIKTEFATLHIDIENQTITIQIIEKQDNAVIVLDGVDKDSFINYVIQNKWN